MPHAMPHAIRRAVRASVAAALLVAPGCTLFRARGAEPDMGPPLGKEERITHVLSRLTFGARPGDRERVATIGVDRWIDQQLHPEGIADSAVLRALEPVATWNEPPATLAVLPPVPPQVARMSLTALMKDSAARASLDPLRRKLAAIPNMNDFFGAGKIVQAQRSDRQLLEVVTDFWENHFSVWDGKMPSREALAVMDRGALRPRALGKFRDLLGAVAHSPAMLFYLDNHLSTAKGLNENYARELLELHTLGVDGGYTQHDVVEVARALTGWTIRRTVDSSRFVFRRDQHDTGTKVVLGHTLRSGRGIEDGEEVLDLLARHPSTAHFIALKLSRRLVSDEPPRALVDRAAATYLATDGDIAQVVRTIVTSREFFSRQAFRAKVKSPFELVVSMRRALDAPADTTTTTTKVIAQLGQRPFGWATPEGWPEKGGPWMNPATIYKRVQLARDAADGKSATLKPDRWSEWATLARLPAEQQVDGVVRSILGDVVDPATRTALESSVTGMSDGTKRLRTLLAVAMASPDFQRR